MDEWTFPIGTRIWKEFRLPIADGGEGTRVETRLLWKIDAMTWYRTTYLWTADGESSATELTTGASDAGGTSYEVPSQQKCNQCHHGRKDGVLGIEAVSLSSPRATGIPIGALADAGLLTAPPAAPYVVPGDATQAAALAWLHSNCGTACHNGGNGQAESTGFWMRLDVATLASVQTTDTYTTGWNQPTQAFPIPGVTGTSYRLPRLRPGIELRVLPRRPPGRRGRDSERDPDAPRRYACRRYGRPGRAGSVDQRRVRRRGGRLRAADGARVRQRAPPQVA